VTSYTRERLVQDLVMGALMALGLTLVAALPLAFLGLRNLLQALRGRLEMPWPTYGELWLVIPGSYLVAGLVGAGAVFLLRPVRRGVIGWVLTGMLVAIIAYDTIGLALAVFYDPVGAIILDHSSQADAWALIPFMTACVAVLGAATGAYCWWRARSGNPIW